MKNNSNGMSTGAAILFTLGIMLCIGWIISLTEPKCCMSGCDNDAREGGRYCYLHQLSYDSYGNPDYNAVYRESVRRRESYSSSTEDTASKNSLTGSSTGSSSSGSASQSTKRTSTKKTNPYESYDEGYEAISEDDDYDWDRYWSDSDYADGVDDAMDEYDW